MILEESKCATCGTVLARIERDGNGVGLSAWSLPWCPKCYGPDMKVNEDGSVEVTFRRPEQTETSQGCAESGEHSDG